MYVFRAPLCTTMKRAGLPYTMAVRRTVTGLAFGYIPEIIEFTKRTSII